MLHCTLINHLRKKFLNSGLFICFLFSPVSAHAVENVDLETLTVQLKWKHAFQFAGYYAAIEKGYYQQAGLNVLLREQVDERSPIESLLAGDAEYSVTGSHVVINRALGQPIVALASIFQHSPSAFLVKKDSGIKRIEDFSGKRIMLLSDGSQNAELLAALRRAGLSDSDYVSLESSFDVFSLERDETDVFNAYVSDQGFRLDQAGIDSRYLLPKTYGVDFYSDILVTTENEVNNNPERVRLFLNATLQGWEYALQHPEEIIDLIIEKYNTQDFSRAHLNYEANVSRELIQPLLVKIGYMNKDRWTHIQNIFAELGFFDAGSNIDGLMYQEKSDTDPVVIWITAHWIMLAVTTSSLFILMLLFFTFQLRRLVKKRTEDLEESEQHWRNLINAEPACVKTLNRAGELLSMNQAGLAVIDADNFEQVDGANLSDLLDEEYRDDFRQLNKKVFSGSQGDLLFKIKSLKGKEVWLETHAAPFYDTKGNITRCLGVTQDVTKRINSENEKQLLQDKLQSAQKMEALGLLTGGIAHDFNNLLGIIIGYTSLALSKHATTEEEKISEYLKNVQDAGERAKALVEQMLAFSRNDAVKSEPMQLYPWIEKDLNLLRSALPSSIKIISDLQEDLPAVSLSPVQLNQILMNLSINARDAMNEQGLLSVNLKMTNYSHLHCDACHKNIEGDWIELSITDTGTGIEPETAKNMFTPFFTTKGVGKGNGMGLAVIYGIAHNNGGHILVESKKGSGTTFSVLFPISPTNENNNSKADNSDPIVSIGNDEHILVVDDEPALAALLGKLLNKNGYRTTVTSDSVEALNLFSKNTDEYSLLVTDQTMPDMTGIELTQKIRKLSPNIPIIICSGFSEKLDQFMTTATNINLLDKPFGGNQFLKLVHDITRKKQKEITKIAQITTIQPTIITNNIANKK